MSDDVLYMLGVVVAGFAVNYGLRALPFVLFAGRGRALPPAVERFGAFVSPVIIAALVVYSYSGLAWRTPWPYLAGALTVALQLWKRNPLASIVAGTVLYMLLLNCGCVSTSALELDAAHPSVRVSNQGVLIGERFVEPMDVVKTLKTYDIPRDRVIHILVDDDIRDLREARMLMGVIAKSGYTRPVLVTKRHAEVKAVSEGDRSLHSRAVVQPAARPKVRYKGANE